MDSVDGDLHLTQWYPLALADAHRLPTEPHSFAQTHGFLEKRRNVETVLRRTGLEITQQALQSFGYINRSSPVKTASSLLPS